MLRNYVLTAYRNLRRNKAFSVINILGLATGMAACLLIVQYITFERSYDRFHDNYQNIYRVANIRHFPTHTDESAGCVTGLGPAMKENFPEVTNFARCYKSDRVFRVDDHAVHFNNVISADSTFLDVFSFPVVHGARQQTLVKPYTAILTESAAKKLFGSEDPVGKSILQVEKPYLVEAVVQDPPANSHIKFDLLLSLTTDLANPNYCMSCNNRNTYVTLAPHTDAKAFETKLQTIIPIIHERKTFKREYTLQPLSSIHLHSHLRFEHEQNGSARNVAALTIVAVLILFIAWLNYINLTTSMAINRAAEVGVRKVNGSTRWNLVAQFLTESLLVNTLALSLAVLMANVAFPFFKEVMAIQTSFTLLYQPRFWIVLAAALIGGVLIYGFYPAFIISSFKPIQALKGKSLLPKGVYRLRLGLVFLQFSLSFMLVAGTLAVYRQIDFMQDTDLGISIDRTLVVPVPAEYRAGGEPFVNDIVQQPGFSMTYASAIPGEENGNVGGGFYVGQKVEEERMQVYTTYVDKNYFEFLEIGFLAGKNITSDQVGSGDQTEIVINDAARKALGFHKPEDALGHILYQDASTRGRIQGVVKDHHTRSLDNPIAPIAYQYAREKNYFLIKPDPATDAAQAVTLVAQAFKKNMSNAPFEFYFLDEQFNQQYNAYIRFGKMFATFTLLAILTACLGISGLTLYTIRVRTREIALRKVLGATVPNLLSLFYSEYVKLTLVAFIVAAPLAYYGIGAWLSSFPYHMAMHWWLFVVPGVLVLTITLLTVSLQSLQTALSNPVKGLRSE
jgi:putative ABC transport system permease protein